MSNILSLSLAAILFLAAGGAPGRRRAGAPTPQATPEAATVRILLINAPGINVEGSRWEIAYEFRIANQAAEWEAWKRRKLKGGSEERLGELIKEGTLKGTLRSLENRGIVLKIPFSPEIRERLGNQPRDPVKITSGQTTPEDIKLLKEQEIKSQIFYFYPVINIYDAKLKKNLIISQPFSWSFGNYPDARFELTVEIDRDGGYSIKSSVPAKKSSD
jgi:hypothetical protein